MRRLALLLAGWMVAGSAAAIDYRSIGEATVLYDAPSQKAQPLFAIARGTPVEEVVALDAWIKVRDQQGDLAWIEKRLLSEQRTVIVRVDQAQIRSQADDNAPVAFEAERSVILELLEPGPAGWVKVKHRDGQQGYVRAAQVWGL